MLKQGIKNYFSSLKFFFTPLGTMFLGMMIGFSILIPGIIGAANTLAGDVNELASTVNLDFKELLSNMWASVQELDWNNPAASLQTLLSIDWLKEILTDALQTILGTDFETFTSEIVTLVGNFSSSVINYVITFVLFWVLGFIVGFFIVKLQIRKNIAKRTLWKVILSTFIGSILTVGYLFAAGFLFSLQSWSVILSVILLILLSGATALLGAYLIYGLGKIPFKSIVNIKNAGLLMLTNLIIFLISIIFTVLACLINILMGIFVGLSLVVIAIIVINLNAESYIQSLVEKQEQNT